MAIVRSWIAAPCAELIWPGARHAEMLFGLLEEAGTAGQSDDGRAYCGSGYLSIEAEVATTDRDFGAVSGGLRWFVPGERRSNR